MKHLVICVMGLTLITTSELATTKTVSQTAGAADFTSIQAAIDSFTEAELQDGVPDEVVILDSATYDEQVILGMMVPAEGQAEGYLENAIEFNKTMDPFTLRGSDPENPPTIAPTTGSGVAYGVFNDDPGDNYTATLSFLGKDLNVANLQIRYNGTTTEYGINGQAGNMSFDNVLFGRTGDGTDGDALINFNNDVNLVPEGFNNSYSFNNCTWDATTESGEPYGGDSVYFHGYSADDLNATGLTPEQAAANVQFDNCTFINGNEAVRLRGNAQPNHVTINRCYLTSSINGFMADGAGSDHSE